MTAPLSRDRSADILNVDLAHVGLLCRYAHGCRERFVVAGSETTERAAKARDAHEVEAHGYQHVPMDTSSWNFAQKFSRAGHSTINTPRKTK